ncbi:MAG: cupin domain-containing protein [Gammaproteobacteria bacterium]|nr:cupin domain-containing protein [Gammaproteobacteria bacterium]
MMNKHKPDMTALENLPPEAVEAFSGLLPERRPAPERLQAMQDKILKGVRAQKPPMGSETLFADQGLWLKFDDFIDFKILHQDPKTQVQTALWRLKPGADFPAHGHASDEECLVLSGSISIGGHELKAGDFHYMYAGHRHPNITSREGALLMIRAEELGEPGVGMAAFLKLRNLVKSGMGKRV